MIGASLALAVGAGVVAGGPANATSTTVAAPRPGITRTTANAVSRPDFAIAFQSDTSGLEGYFSDHRPDRDLGARVMPGTTPAIVRWPNDIRVYQVAFHGANGDLWTLLEGNAPVDLGFAMAPGASPVAANTFTGGTQIAFEANTGLLWTTGSAGTVNTGLPVAPGTNPAIIGVADGGYQIFYQDPTGHLSGYTANGFHRVSGITMAPATSPGLGPQAGPGGTFRIVWQGANHDLFESGLNGPIDTGLGMAPGTSPSVYVAGSATSDTFEVAFQANTGQLWVTGTSGTGSLNLGMQPGTSPAITQQVDSPGYEVAFQANTGTLWLAGQLNQNTGLRMSGSPSVTPVVNFFAGG